CTCDELLLGPRRARDADDRQIELPAARHRVQGREDFLVRQVPGGAEEHERVGLRVRAHFFSWWPPNWKRIADRSRFWKSASPRELKRAYSAADSTGAGTPSSMPAWIVHRPSPESDTRPAKPARLASSASAAAVRSRSHDAMTLPRRHTSAILA